LHINKGRKVSGTLRGYDNFMNIVLDEAIDETPGANSAKIGMVVSYY
jgi:small nuclear ribonucleoprotein G